MTRKDYNLIASVLLDNRAGMPEHNFYWLVHNFATALQEENPRFDGDRFLEACGIA